MPETIPVTCSPALHAQTLRAAKKAGLPMTEYVRQAIRLRQYLEDNGWSKGSCAAAQDLIRQGAWKDK